MTMELAVKTLEEALQEHEVWLEDLQKAGNRLAASVKTWRKACAEGDLATRDKAQAQVEELVPQVAQKAQEAKESWEFDARDYLEGERWRQELIQAGEKAQVPLLQDASHLVAPPVLVRAMPGRTCLQIGKKAWPRLRPKLVVAELKRLRDKKANAGAQEFLEHLYLAWKDLPRKGAPMVTFREIYERFAQAPGWKKENPRPDFGLQIHALARSEVRMTRDGTRYSFEFPSAKAKESDIFTVYREDGSPIRYYGIEFR